MEQWQVDLIEAAASSAQFDTSTRELRRRVLLYLAQHPRPEDRKARSERELTDQFPSIGTNIPHFIKRLNAVLDEYFDSEQGALHDYRIHVISGNDADARRKRYVVEYPANKNALLRHFWEPYLEGKPSTLIAYGVPLFVRNREQTVFTRHVEINEPAEAAKIQESGEEPCWPFVTHGDLEAVIHLLSWLRERNRTVDFKHFRADAPLAEILNATADDSHVIVVGSARVNGLLREYQTLALDRPTSRGARGSANDAQLPFQLRLYDVVQLDEHGRIVRTFEEERRGDSTQVPVVVTRRKGLVENAVTLVGANHGRAVHRVAKELTKVSSLARWFDDPLLRPWRKHLPPEFQIVLRVRVFDGEQMAGNVAVEAVWPSRMSSPPKAGLTGRR